MFGASPGPGRNATPIVSQPASHARAGNANRQNGDSGGSVRCSSRAASRASWVRGRRPRRRRTPNRCEGWATHLGRRRQPTLGWGAGCREPHGIVRPSRRRPGTPSARRLRPPVWIEQNGVRSRRRSGEVAERWSRRRDLGWTGNQRRHGGPRARDRLGEPGLLSKQVCPYHRELIMSYARAVGGCGECADLSVPRCRPRQISRADTVSGCRRRGAGRRVVANQVKTRRARRSVTALSRRVSIT